MFSPSKTLKPVARISTSAACSVPSAVRTPAAVNASIGVVSSATLSRLNVRR